MAELLLDKRQNLLKSCFKELQSCIDYVNHYSNSKEQHFEIFKNIAKEYSEIEIQHGRAQRAREATEKHLDNQENDCIEEVQQIYNKYLEEQPTNSSYKSHSIWRKVNNVIGGRKEDEDAGAAIDSDVSDIADNNESIDEGIIPSQFEPPIDPITKRTIENPCRNRSCGHVYEYVIVMEHLKTIKQNKSKARCPYIGCPNVNMRSSFIVKDNALKLQIQNYLADKQNNLNTSQNNDTIESQDEGDIL